MNPFFLLRESAATSTVAAGKKSFATARRHGASGGVGPASLEGEREELGASGAQEDDDPGQGAALPKVNGPRTLLSFTCVSSYLCHSGRLSTHAPLYDNSKETELVLAQWHL